MGGGAIASNIFVVVTGISSYVKGCTSGIIGAVNNITPFICLHMQLYVHCEYLQVYTYTKIEVTEENLEVLMTKMMKFGVTIQQNHKVLQLPEIVCL